MICAFLSWKRRPGFDNNFTQRLHLIWRQFSPLTSFEAAIVQRTNADATQRAYWMPNRFTHPSHLPVPSLTNGQPQGAFSIASRTEQHDIGGESSATIQHDALPELFDRFCVGRAGNPHLVGSLNAVPGMGELRGEVPIIRQQQQTFGVVIEAPYGVHVFAHVAQKIDHRRPTLRIRAGGHISSWFVQEDVADALRRSQTTAVYADVVLRRVGLGPHDAHGFAIHRYAPVGDQFFGGASGGNPGFGKNFLEAFLHGPRAG
jgi:hypothetical protein